MKTTVILILLASVLVLLIQLLENEHFPLPSGKPRGSDKALLTEAAVLVKKTAETAADTDGVTYENLLLEFDTGGRTVKCYVTGRIYRQVHEGMEGLLTHRGNHYKCFEVGGVKIEK